VSEGFGADSLRSIAIAFAIGVASCGPVADRTDDGAVTPSRAATVAPRAESAPRLATASAATESAATASAAPSASAPAPVESATAEASPPASSAPCPSDMVLAGRACIDRYEAPNQVGAKPLRMQSALDAEAWCKERGKRLCSEDEWVRACEGPNRLAFPYGAKWERGRCNDDGSFRNPSWSKLARWPAPEAVAEADKLDQSNPSGERSQCVSAEGAHDLSGNVAEWVRRTRDNPTNYEHVVKGCFWGRCFRPPHLPSCDYVNYAHPSGYRSYEMGFRCCVEPKG
jgi:hypothetical protein